MKRLFVSQSLVEVESLKELLGTDGILCTIRNQQGSSLAGEVPFVEVFPELWVVNDADFVRAKELLEEQGSGDDVERPPLFRLSLEGGADWSPTARVQRGSSETAHCTSKGDHLDRPLILLPSSLVTSSGMGAD